MRTCEGKERTFSGMETAPLRSSICVGKSRCDILVGHASFL